MTCLCAGDKVYDPEGGWLGKLDLEAVGVLLVMSNSRKVYQGTGPDKE
jgi:hypothetical protein